MKLLKTRTCLYCRACSGSSCLLGYKTKFYEKGEFLIEKSAWDSEGIYIKPAERCPKPRTINDFLCCLNERKF